MVSAIFQTRLQGVSGNGKSMLTVFCPAVYWVCMVDVLTGKPIPGNGKPLMPVDCVLHVVSPFY